MNQSSEQTNNELKDKPVLSPPTPMLLLPSQATNIEDDNNNKTIEPNVTKLALIEAHDSAEMNLILSTIRQIFPGVNVHMCNDDKNLKLQQDSKTYLTVSRPNCSSPEYNKTNSRNSLNTKKTSDRASSIDNSSLSNDTSIERQESKDSGFWTRTKCSFESMKSLSISDHSNKNTNEIPVNQNTNNEENSSTTNTLSTSISTAFNNENDTSKNYLTSPRSSIGYNWKKWKKGQAWRYNSSSNTNLSDNSTQNGSLNNDTSHIRTNNASFNSDNSSFSIERTEDESNESYSNNTNSTSYFSNSFELATSKLSLLHQVSLQPWSSTSKLEVINSSGIDSSQILSQKRRGKLVRDRTIDTPDEATTTNSFSFQQKETNVKFASSTNLNEETDRWSSSPLSCSTPSQMFKEKEKLNGRVSPPEKRVSLCFKGDSENDKVENILKNEEIQNAIYTALSSNSKLDPNDLKQIISNILSSKTLFSEDLIKQITEMNNEVNQRVTYSSPTSSCPSPSSSITPVSPLSSGLIPTVKKLSLLSPKSISPSQITTPHQVQYDFHKDLQSKLNLKSNSESEDTQDVSDHLVKNSYSFAPFKSMQQENDNQKSDPTACLNPNCNKNPNLKNINSSSFDYKFINNNYLANNLAQSNNNKPIYRSNSSPSYSSSQLPDPAAQFTSPLFTKNNDSNNDLINFNEQTKINCFQQQLQQQPYFPFNFNFNKSLPQSTTNLNYNQFDQHFHLQHQQHLLQKNTYYPINGLEANISMASKHLNNNRLIKPPAIVITESKIDYEENDNKNFLSNQIDSSERNIGKNETFEAMIRSNEFNRNKFMNNSFGFNQSFESAIKKLPENMLKNNDNYWKANSLNLNQAKDIKSMQSTAATAASKALKSHICTSCQKRFARSDMLIRHSRLHSGVRPYRCNRCGQEFSRSDHLNTHLRTHTGEKPYTCPHPKCSYAACRKDMITRHLKVHSKNNLSRLSLSFDSAKLSENNLRSKLLFESPFKSSSSLTSF